MSDLIAGLAAAGVHTLLLQFTDAQGVAKGKYLPLHQLPTVLATGAGFAGPSIVATGLPRTRPALGVLRSRRCQHAARPALHARRGAAGRRRLRRRPALRRLPAPGAAPCARTAGRARLDLQTGIEPEFFLLRQTPAAGCRPTMPTGWTSRRTT
jgi:glutamine synthetase